MDFHNFMQKMTTALVVMSVNRVGNIELLQFRVGANRSEQETNMVRETFSSYRSLLREQFSGRQTSRALAQLQRLFSDPHILTANVLRYYCSGPEMKLNA